MEWSRAYCMFPSRSRKTRAKPASRGVKMSELRDSSRGTRSEANVSAFFTTRRGVTARQASRPPQSGARRRIRADRDEGECPRFRREILRPGKENAAGNSLHIGKAFDAGGAEKIRLLALGCSERPSQRKGECPRFRREILRPGKENAAGNSLHIGKAFDAGGAEKIRRKPNANSFDAIK